MHRYLLREDRVTTHLIRQREVGACFAYSKADGSAYAFARDEFQPLLQEWMSGRAFYAGLSVYGSPLTVKLGDIVAVSDVSPEALAAQRDDRKADERDDALET
jgi:hypothetical protein